MLHACGQPSYENDGNEIWYKAPLHNLQRFGCYTSQHICKQQHNGHFGPDYNPCMMVGYIHNLTRLWMIWDPAFHLTRSLSENIFNVKRNAHISFLQADQTNIFELAEEPEYVKDIETSSDGLLHANPGNVQPGEGHRSGNHDRTHHDTDCNLPDADNHRSLPSSACEDMSS